MFKTGARQRLEISERMGPVFFLFCGFMLCFFDVFAETPAYRVAGGVCPESVWAAIFIFVACFEILAQYKRIKWMRRLALFLAAVTWGVWAVFLGMGNPHGFGFGLYSTNAAMAAWTFVRAR